MLTLTRLPIARQRAVGQQLRELLASHKSLNKAVLADLRAVIAATDVLDAAPTVPKFTIDTTTDAVVFAIVANLESVQNAMRDTIVPLDRDEIVHRDAATFVLHHAFGHGTDFLRIDMPLEYAALRRLADAFATADVARAIKTLGIGYMVRHFDAHLGPYGRAVTAPDGASVEAASDAWHAAFEQLAISVRAHYRGDAATQTAVLGPYERELASHIDEQRAARRRRAAHKGAAAPGPSTPAA